MSSGFYLVAYSTPETTISSFKSYIIASAQNLKFLESCGMFSKRKFRNIYFQKLENKIPFPSLRFFTPSPVQTQWCGTAFMVKISF